MEAIDQTLQAPLERVATRLQHLGGEVPLLLVALVVFGVAWILAGWLSRWDLPYRRLRESPFLADLMRQVARGGVLCIGLVLALDVLNATGLVASLIGAAGIAGLALGFALRDLVENYVASVLLSVRQPFAPNDYISIDGHEGKVIRMSDRATILMTADGNNLRIPNATVFKGTILNYTSNPQRRFTVKLTVEYRTDLMTLQDLGLAVLRQTEGVLAAPQPAFVVQELGPLAVVVSFFAWVDQSRNDFGKVQSEALRRVKAACDAAGIRPPETLDTLRAAAAAGTRAQRDVAVHELPPPSDVSPDTHLDQQIDRDRERSGSRDLLRPERPRE